jgi:hypothetical protein
MSLPQELMESQQKAIEVKKAHKKDQNQLAESLAEISTLKESVAISSQSCTSSAILFRSQVL